MGLAAPNWGSRNEKRREEIIEIQARGSKPVRILITGVEGGRFAVDRI